MGEGECEPNEPLKKARHRKKQLFSTILQQMEFYFSDSNLSKDRFLSQLLSKDLYVDLNTFLSFNRIRKLNCSLEDIKKAISKSELIELSDDREKVRRKTPLVSKNNVDDCTIYVENIKADADHEWLNHVFSDFGQVVYVSIPKYKHSKGNKGFAFIEFENVTDAQNAISYFESIGCKMPSDTLPDDLVSIKTFIIDKQDSEEKTGCQINMSKTDIESKNTKKRKISEHIENKGEKRLRLDSECEITNKGELSDSLQTEEMESRKKKKHRKDKRKNFIRDLGLKVLSKKEWKKLRNRYLDLQRKKMKEFKQYFHKQKAVTENLDKVSAKEIFEHDEFKEKDLTAAVDFVPGVIVRIILSKPSPDAKKLKNEIKALSTDIKYVDIPLPTGSEEIFVRFSNPGSAKQFCEQDFPGLSSKTIVEGDKETEYWEKIQDDRSVKMSKNVKKQRGRDKLLKKAEKLRVNHLRFNEGE